MFIHGYFAGNRIKDVNEIVKPEFDMFFKQQYGQSLRFAGEQQPIVLQNKKSDEICLTWKKLRVKIRVL